jgi:hypothetical protein
MNLNPFELNKRKNALRTAIKKRLGELQKAGKEKDKVVAELMVMEETTKFTEYFKATVPFRTSKEKVEASLTEELRAEFSRMAEEGYARKPDAA